MTFLENLCKEKISRVLLCCPNNEMRKERLLSSFFYFLFFIFGFFTQRKDFAVYPKGTT